MRTLVITLLCLGAVCATKDLGEELVRTNVCLCRLSGNIHLVSFGTNKTAAVKN